MRSPSVPLVGLSRSSTFIPELESLRGIAVSLVLSALTYRWIERPFLVRKARVDS